MVGITHSWDMDAKKLLLICFIGVNTDSEMSRIFHLCGFECVLTTLTGNRKSLLLCVDHSQVLPRSRLDGSEQESVCDADSCLLTQ